MSRKAKKTHLFYKGGPLDGEAVIDCVARSANDLPPIDVKRDSLIDHVYTLERIEDGKFRPRKATYAYVAAKPAANIDGPTDTIRAILRLIYLGCSIPQIASLMGKAQYGVAKRRRQIMDRLHVRNTAELVREIGQRELVRPTAKLKRWEKELLSDLRRRDRKALRDGTATTNAPPNAPKMSASKTTTAYGRKAGRKAKEADGAA